MIQRWPLFLSLLFFPYLVFAHEVPVYPVDVKLSVEPQVIRVRVESPAAYWLVEILGASVAPPPANWPDHMKSVIRNTLDESFQLFMDGLPLPAASLECRYIEEPLQWTKPRVQFDLVYPLDPNGKILSGQTQFFTAEHERHLNDAGSGAVHEEYLTRLTLSGKGGRLVELPIEKPQFSFPISDLIMTPGEYAKECFNAAIRQFLLDPFWTLLCVAIVAILRGFQPHRVRTALFTWTTSLLLTAFSFLALKPFISEHHQTFAWAGLAVLVAPTALKKSGGKASLVLLFLCCVLIWPGLMAEELTGLPYAPSASAAIKPAYLGGMVTAGALISVIINLMTGLFKRKLSGLYESIAESMLLSHLRAACGLILFISIAQAIKRGLGG